MTVTYFMTSGFGGATVTRTDANIDINKNVAPPGATPSSTFRPATVRSYSARWEGEIVPSFTEDHTFYVVGSGSAGLTSTATPCHSCRRRRRPRRGPPAPMTRALGPQAGRQLRHLRGGDLRQRSVLLRRRLSLVLLVRAGVGRECIAEVATYCRASRRTAPLPTPPGSPQVKSAPVALQAGVHYRIRSSTRTRRTDKTVRLLVGEPRQAKQTIPQSAFYPKAVAAAGAVPASMSPISPPVRCGDADRPD